MSMAIACWIRSTVLQENLKQVNYKKTFLNSMVFTKTTLNTTVPGMNGYKSEKKLDKIKDVKNIYKNHGWILKG